MDRQSVEELVGQDAVGRIAGPEAVDPGSSTAVAGVGQEALLLGAERRAGLVEPVLERLVQLARGGAGPIQQVAREDAAAGPGLVDDERLRPAEGVPELLDLAAEQRGEGGMQLGTGVVVAGRAERHGTAGGVAGFRGGEGGGPENGEGERAALTEARAG